MTDSPATHLRSLWRHYRRRSADIERARRELDDAIEDVLTSGAMTQADIARALGASRQDVQESVRRQQRRRDRGEIP